MPTVSAPVRRDNPISLPWVGINAVVGLPASCEAYLVARFSAEQIYGFARAAGFTPDQAATMTAIALAESGGRSRAQSPGSEDSRGLWQINAGAHPGLASRLDLYDPRDNARAAFEVSGGGNDISPWTVTHGGASARYLRFRAQAEAAAVAHGDGAGRGMWSGTSGFGDTTPAGDGGAGSGADTTSVAFETASVAATVEPSVEGGESADAFLRAALAQKGDSYFFGAEASGSDPDPDTFDCSELTEWAAAQAGVTIPDGSFNQYLMAKERGWLVPVEQAEQIPGALLFDFSTEPVVGGGRPSVAHVAISQGEGRTIEAKSPADGVDEFSSAGRFGFAAVIPGLAGGTATAEVLEDDRDTDRDGITDVEERRLGLDPASADTDRDGLSDAHERDTTGTDPRLPDTDGDRLDDAFELARGLDPAEPDTGRGALLDVAAVSSDGRPAGVSAQALSRGCRRPRQR